MTETTWTRTPAGAYEAETSDGQRLAAFKDATGRAWCAMRDGVPVEKARTLREAKAAAEAAAEMARERDEAADDARDAEAVEPVRESRQVRRARERAERKRATHRGPFDGGRARPGVARSLSAAAPGDPSPAAVPWSTPVRPLTGAARNCVWGGTTPPEQARAASFAYWRQKGLPAAEAIERHGRIPGAMLDSHLFGPRSGAFA